jgi:hypothetical protein
MRDEDIVKELQAIRKDLASQTHCKGGSSNDGGGCLAVILLLILLFHGPCDREDWELGPKPSSLGPSQSEPPLPRLIESRAARRLSVALGVHRRCCSVCACAIGETAAALLRRSPLWTTLSGEPLVPDAGGVAGSTTSSSQGIRVRRLSAGVFNSRRFGDSALLRIKCRRDITMFPRGCAL